MGRKQPVIVTEKTEDDEENVNELGQHGSGRPLNTVKKAIVASNAHPINRLGWLGELLVDKAENIRITDVMLVS